MTASLRPGWIWRQYSSGCYLLEQGDAKTLWVFGLRWLPTVNVRSRKLLLAQLHREKVRWWTTPSVQSRTIGFLPHTESVQTARADVRLRCAAAQFALKHPQGTHLLRLTIESGLHWIVAVSDGNVLCHTDCWVDSEALADQVEQSILQRFEAVDVTRCLVAAQLPCADANLAFLLDDQTPPHVYLRRLRSPLPLRTGGLGLLVFAVFAWWAWSGEHKDELISVRGSGVDLGREGDAGPVEWRFSRPGDLGRIVHFWADLPINPKGWLLRGVSCPIDSERTTCRARYKRTSPEFSNLQLKVVEEAGWRMLPFALDQTEFIKPIAMDTIHLPESQVVAGASSWVIQLQQISGMTHIVDVSAPTSVVSGSGAYPVRQLRIVLPLKHLNVIDALSLPVVWKAIHLEIADMQADKSMATRLLTYLEGELIERS